jgi:hypothetical protein
MKIKQIIITHSIKEDSLLNMLFQILLNGPKKWAKNLLVGEQNLSAVIIKASILLNIGKFQENSFSHNYQKRG